MKKHGQKFKNKNRETAFYFFIIFGLTNFIFHANAQSISDFSSDVQKGLAEKNNTAISSLLSNIKSQDYKSSWDEFGTNILVDGELPPTVTQNNIVEDIANDLNAQLSYDQVEEQYLKLKNITPEEVVATEGEGGGDLLPQDYIDPQPSLDANPEVNPSALDVSVATDTLETISTSNSSSTEDLSTSLDATSTYQDTLLPPTGTWTSEDIQTFKDILNINDQAPATDPTSETNTESTNNNSSNIISSGTTIQSDTTDTNSTSNNTTEASSSNTSSN